MNEANDAWDEIEEELELPSAPEAIESYIRWHEERNNFVMEKGLGGRVCKGHEHLTPAQIRNAKNRMIKDGRLFLNKKGALRGLTMRRPIATNEHNKAADRMEQLIEGERIPYFPHPKWNITAGGGLVRGTHTGLLVRFSWGKSNQVCESVATLQYNHPGKYKTLILSTEESDAMYSLKMRECLEKKFELTEKQAREYLDDWEQNDQVVVHRVKLYEPITPDSLKEFIEYHGGFDLIVTDYVCSTGPLYFAQRVIGLGPPAHQCAWLRDFGSEIMTDLRVPAIVTYLQPKLDKELQPTNEGQGDAQGALLRCFHAYLRPIQGGEIEETGSRIYELKYEVINAKGEFYPNLQDDFTIKFDRNKFKTEEFNVHTIDIGDNNTGSKKWEDAKQDTTIMVKCQ